jgi:hypothetical protein
VHPLGRAGCKGDEGKAKSHRDSPDYQPIRTLTEKFPRETLDSTKGVVF